MNGSAVSRQNGDGTADRLAIRLTRRAPGSDDERSPYKTVQRSATIPPGFDVQRDCAHENERGRNPAPPIFRHKMRNMSRLGWNSSRPAPTCRHSACSAFESGESVFASTPPTRSRVSLLTGICLSFEFRPPRLARRFPFTLPPPRSCRSI
ncbi:hypothetical protein GD416_29905 [Burkholderia sp. BE24]|nr:hypothetical protein [Burkholderia sp. BE24]